MIGGTGARLRACNNRVDLSEVQRINAGGAHGPDPRAQETDR